MALHKKGSWNERSERHAFALLAQWSLFQLLIALTSMRCSAIGFVALLDECRIEVGFGLHDAADQLVLCVMS